MVWKQIKCRITLALEPVAETTADRVSYEVGTLRLADFHQ